MTVIHQSKKLSVDLVELCKGGCICNVNTVSTQTHSCRSNFVSGHGLEAASDARTFWDVSEIAGDPCPVLRQSLLLETEEARSHRSTPTTAAPTATTTAVIGSLCGNEKQQQGVAGLSTDTDAVFRAGAPESDATTILATRRRLLGSNMALFFSDDPLHIVKGQGCKLFDPEGNDYLDCINNVSHVGHCHPRVAAAVSQQMFTLNTNSRYLHEGLVTLAERLLGTFAQTNPESADCYDAFIPVVSGSEANDLAWRIACARAGNVDSNDLHVAVVDHAYHGHTAACINLSPYKFCGPGGQGQQPHVHVIPCPDPYRGVNLDGAAAARKVMEEVEASGGKLAAFFCESVISCGGQVVLPPGWLAGVYSVFQPRGVVCVADEVQCGFGRVGSKFWGFELSAELSLESGGMVSHVRPDIVTCGKPMGNGFPCAGVVTYKSVAAPFTGSGMEFFATFGGCTAATAAALAVLDVLKEEKLQESALEVGKYTMQRLRQLQERYPTIIGDVRGVGLMIGMELVSNASSKSPAPATASFVKSHCKSVSRVLLSTEGPYSNVIKIKPPLCFSTTDVDRMVGALDAALASYLESDDETLVFFDQENVSRVALVDQRRAQLLRW